MGSLEDKLEQINQEKNRILEEINKQNKAKSIPCKCCDNPHKIGDLVAIQTHRYILPRGCMEGDYWLEGELQFVCPETGVKNRLLFDNYDVPFDKRENFQHNPDMQFKVNYGRLFREVVDEYNHIKGSGRSVNNYFVDEHRKEFGLVEKKAK